MHRRGCPGWCGNVVLAPVYALKSIVCQDRLGTNKEMLEKGVFSAGGGAMAYFPKGTYELSSTIVIRGKDFYIGGGGYQV